MNASGRDRHRRRLRQRHAADGADPRARREGDLGPLLDQKILPVVTGFNGCDRSTAGRPRSAAAARISRRRFSAAALDAAELWIWTDVDGIMTGDPRLVPDARVLDEITYTEAAELAYNGAKVLHPRTLAPLVERQIPVWSKNSFAPGEAGHADRLARSKARGGPHAVTSMADVALVSIEPASSALSGTRVMARALEALDAGERGTAGHHQFQLSPELLLSGPPSGTGGGSEYLEESLSLELAHGYLKPIEVDNDVGLIAVVGEGMRGTPGLAGRIFTAISRQNINIIAIAQGSSELTSPPLGSPFLVDFWCSGADQREAIGSCGLHCFSF